MNTAVSFKEFFESSFLLAEDSGSAKNQASQFFADFIYYTPLKVELLLSYVSTGNIENFYQSLADLKYLIEFSDSINRYWFLLRAYSGALAKLKVGQSVKSSKKLYFYYFEKYGNRRILKNEHWFEQKRWEFLDELALIYSQAELDQFIAKYQQILLQNFATFSSFILLLVEDLKKICQEEGQSKLKA